MDRPLITHFEPRTLSELGIDGNQLEFSVSYQPKSFAKTGIQALLAKTPFGDNQPIAMDIDVSCGLYDELGRLIDVVWFGNKRALSDKIRHHGDTFFAMNKNYRPAMVDEYLSVRTKGRELDKVYRMAFFVHSYYGHALNQTMGEVSLSGSKSEFIHQVPLIGFDDGGYAFCVWELTRCDDDWQVSAPMRSLTAKDAGEMAKKWHIAH